MAIPIALYEYYQQRERIPTENYSIYVTDPSDDALITDLVDMLRWEAQKQGFDQLATTNFAVSFVQSLPYTSDEVTTQHDEYPRYPIETLYDNGGDCEDTCILLAAVLRAMDYDVVLLRLPEHMALGVRWDSGVSGAYYDHDGARYYYLETTGTGWVIGEIPDEYKSASVTIYDIVPTPILLHTWSGTSRGLTYTLKITVENLGTADAESLFVEAGFDTGDDVILNAERSSTISLKAGYSVEVTIVLVAPEGVHARLLVQTVLDGYVAYDTTSEWFDT